MSSVDLAIGYARKMVNAEARGPGDIENALDRLEAKTGVGRWTWWALWHRRRKAIDDDLMGRIRGAYLSLCERQIRHWQHEQTIEAARTGHAPDQDLAFKAEELLAEIEARKAQGATGRPSLSDDDRF